MFYHMYNKYLDVFKKDCGAPTLPPWQRVNTATIYHKKVIFLETFYYNFFLLLDAPASLLTYQHCKKPEIYPDGFTPLGVITAPFFFLQHVIHHEKFNFKVILLRYIIAESRAQVTIKTDLRYRLPKKNEIEKTKDEPVLPYRKTEVMIVLKM